MDGYEDDRPSDCQAREAPLNKDHEQEFAGFASGAMPALSRVAWLLVLDQHDADDLLQEALARVYARWPTISGRGFDPYSYTRRVLVNLRTDRWRARRNRVLAESAWQRRRPPQGRDTADTAIEQADLVMLLSRLSERDRAILALRYVLDLSVDETADTLNISPAAVKMASSRAISRLRTQWKELSR